MAENKIRYGLSNVYAAVASIGTDGSATYDTPFSIPGAVNLSLSPEGERTVFYADNIEYWVCSNNHGYSGSLEVACLPEQFKTDILGMAFDSNGVLYEDADADIVHFALLFQFEGDQKARKHVLYNCTAARVPLDGSTKNENIDPQTESFDLQAGVIYNAALTKNLVKANSEEDTDSTTYSGWESAVYQPTAEAT